MIKKLIYVSSPYSHTDESVVEERVLLVTKYVAKLVRDGIMAISPITYGDALLKVRKLPSDYAFWNTFCLSLLSKCYKMIVYKIDGWEESIGVKDEIRYCLENNIEVEYIEVED